MPASTQPLPSRKRELKSERLELRITPSRKAVIQRAMSISGQSAGDLAFEGALKVLEEQERMVLAGADREVFLKAVMKPPKPNKKLIEAFRFHSKAVG